MRRRQATRLTLVAVAMALPCPGAWAAADTRPVDRTIADPRITESSGLVASSHDPSVLWTMNDSGHPPLLYAVAADGRTVAVARLLSVLDVDWEALAVGHDRAGRPVLWVGDVGSSGAARRGGLLLHRIPDPPIDRDSRVRPTTYRLLFRDHSRNVEAMWVDPKTQRIYLVSKEPSHAGIYAAPARMSTTQINRLTRVAAAPPTITDATTLPDGRIAMRNYRTVYLYDRIGSPPTQVELPRQDQGESLAVTPDGTALLAGQEAGDRSIVRVPVPGRGQSATPSPATGTGSATAAPAPATASPAARHRVPAARRFGSGAVVVAGGVALSLFLVVLLWGRSRR